MKPVVTIVGRPNVGKSTLFNRLTHTRGALVINRPGVTRDRQYGVCRYQSRSLLIVDTAGMGENSADNEGIVDKMTAQSMQAVTEASLLIWVMDGKAHLNHIDSTLAKTFRKQNKPLLLAINKLEGRSADAHLGDFFSLGFSNIIPISAKHGDGMGRLLAKMFQQIPASRLSDRRDGTPLTISVLGRPNVGKSTLINRMTGEERMLTFDKPGTTRDSVPIYCRKNHTDYTLIDTAGVRGKNKTRDIVEKFSVLQSFIAINDAKITILLLDAHEGVTKQDAKLLGMIATSGKPTIIAINKSDTVKPADRQRIKLQLSRKFSFVDYAKYRFISALHGTGVDCLFKDIDNIAQSLQLTISASDLTNMLETATKQHPPQIVFGRRIKLRYAHLGGQDPIRIIIHGNQTDALPDNYKRYLANFFQRQLKCIGTPVLIELKQNDNPYKKRKNKVTKHQTNKRHRRIQYAKRS